MKYSMTIAILFTMFSCDCTYIYNFVIENKTNKNVIIRLKPTFQFDTNNISVPSGKSINIYSTNFFPGGGCPGTQPEHFNKIIESLRLTTHNFVLDLSDKNLWKFKILKKGYCEFRYEIK